MMSSDNKTQYYVVNAFLRTILIFISFFFAEKKKKTTAFPQVLLRERAAPSRDSFLRIGFFDTRSRNAARPRERVSRKALFPRERSFLVLEDFDEGFLRENQSAAPADIENSLAHFCASRTMNMPRMHDGFRTQICVCVFSKNLLPG